jgi:hypothetical protein
MEDQRKICRSSSLAAISATDNMTGCCSSVRRTSGRKSPIRLKHCTCPYVSFSPRIVFTRVPVLLYSVRRFMRPLSRTVLSVMTVTDSVGDFHVIRTAAYYSGSERWSNSEH